MRDSLWTRSPSRKWRIAYLFSEAVFKAPPLTLLRVFDNEVIHAGLWSQSQTR